MDRKNENEYPDISGIFDIDDDNIPSEAIKLDRSDRKEIKEPILTATDDLHTLPEEQRKPFRQAIKKEKRTKRRNKAKTRLIIILSALIAAFLIFTAVKNAVTNSKKPVVTFEKPAQETITRYYQEKGIIYSLDGSPGAVFIDNNYDVHFISENMPAEIITDSGTFPAKIKAIKEELPTSPLIEKYYSILTSSKPEASVYGIYALPEDGSTLPAEGTKISVKVITKTVDDALTIPSKSVYINGNQSYVWIYEPVKKSLARQDVITGISSDGKTEITAGIKKSDRIVTSASCKSEEIHEGMEVKTD